MGCASGYEFVEGATGDLTFRARGRSVEAVFASAAEALLAATVAEPDAVRRLERRHIVLEEPDLELLLLRFLNELVFLRDAEDLLLHAVHLLVDRGAGVRLEVELAGEPIDRRRHALQAEVKAATAHGLRVAPSGDGWIASATLDV